MICSGVPSSTIFPSCITSTRSQKDCTNARLWQINRKESWFSYFRDFNSSIICC